MQLIDANAKMIDKYFNKKLIDVRDCPCDGCPENPCGHPAKCVKFALWLNKTVDAVPVVRCKDCKYLAEAFDESPCCKRLWRTAVPYVREDDFCSYGERKDNE